MRILAVEGTLEGQACCNISFRLRVWICILM